MSRPRKRFCVTALPMTPAKAAVSIILSAAMLVRPAWWLTVAHSATNTIEVEIRNVENRKD